MYIVFETAANWFRSNVELIIVHANTCGGIALRGGYRENDRRKQVSYSSPRVIVSTPEKSPRVRAVLYYIFMYKTCMQ